MLVSATEWMPSASIDDDRVKPSATNFMMAIPRLAKSAARTARVLPLATTRASSGWAGGHRIGAG